MNPRAYYNEFDRHAAAWLRELIKAGLIMPGEVDERSIHDVRADDLRGFNRVHFFTGIGGWDYALQLARWPDDRPVWTGSCPCQPYSSAGKRKGNADDRNLWPEMFRLICECRPDVVFGEQVASAIGHGWLDGVSADLEGEGYACGATVLGAHGVGAPHIRQRLYWVAEAGSSSTRRHTRPGFDCQASRGVEAERSWKATIQSSGGGAIGELANTSVAASEWDAGELLTAQAGVGGKGQLDGSLPERLEHGCTAYPLDNADLSRRGQQCRTFAVESQHETVECAGGDGGVAHARHCAGCSECKDKLCERDCRFGQSSPWSDFDLIPCRDGKSRRVEPGTFPLAHGVPARVVRLRGYGNAIVPQVAAEFIQAYCEVAAAASPEREAVSP